LMTLFGEVTVRRLGYGARGEESVFPLDGELNLPRDSYSHGLRRRLAEEVAGSSFDEAVLGLERTTGGKVPKRQAEALAARSAKTSRPSMPAGGAMSRSRRWTPW
jgi:hypothetical protein